MVPAVEMIQVWAVVFPAVQQAWSSQHGLHAIISSSNYTNRQGPHQSCPVRAPGCCSQSVTMVSRTSVSGTALLTLSFPPEKNSFCHSSDIRGRSALKMVSLSTKDHQWQTADSLSLPGLKWPFGVQEPGE